MMNDWPTFINAGYITVNNCNIGRQIRIEHKKCGGVFPRPFCQPVVILYLIYKELLIMPSQKKKTYQLYKQTVLIIVQQIRISVFFYKPLKYIRLPIASISAACIRNVLDDKTHLPTAYGKIRNLPTKRTGWHFIPQPRT